MQSGFLLPLTPVARCIQNKPLIRQVLEDLRGAGYRFMGRIQRPVKCLLKGLPIRIDPKPGEDAVPADLPVRPGLWTRPMCFWPSDCPMRLPMARCV